MTDGPDREIATVFDRIAARYDFLNRVLSFGTDIGWRWRAIAHAEIRAGMRVLDVGAGAGDLSFAAASRGAQVVAIDLSAGAAPGPRGRGAPARPPPPPPPPPPAGGGRPPPAA